MKRFFKASAVFLAIFSLGSSVFSQEIFNSNLSAQEKESLSKGETVIRNVDSLKNLALASSDAVAAKALKVVSDLKPAYIAEIIHQIPYEGNENFLDDFTTLIEDVPSYAGIPYFSERNQTWYDLYSSAEIMGKKTEGNRTDIRAALYMEPFGNIDSSIVIEKTDSSLYYEMMNLNKLRYLDKFTCVNPEKMKSVIVIFRSGENWVLYGVGAVNAPSIFFLRERVETSFMNRIKTFCAYFFKQL